MKTKVLMTFALFALLVGNFTAYSATLQVTNENDNGDGSLRQTIANANSGDTIIFAPNVNYITLTSGHIEINKNLTINGESGNTRITIDGNSNSGIFDILGSVNINNLTFTKGYGISISGDATAAILVDTNATFTANNCTFSKNVANCGSAVLLSIRSTFIANNCTFTENSATNDGGAVLVIPSSTFIANNCTFNQNAAYYGGAIFVYMRATFIANNCTFIENLATVGIGSTGGAIYLLDSATFTANNCSFTKNSATNASGAVNIDVSATFTANNCTFNQNMAYYGGVTCIEAGGIFIANNCAFNQNTANHRAGAVDVHPYAIFIADNCTFSQNIADCDGDTTMAKVPGGGAICLCDNTSLSYLYHCTFDGNQSPIGNAINNNGGTLYSYNCIYTGATPQIARRNIAAGNNLIEGVNATRSNVFGNNQFNGQYITPLDYAKSATRLTASDIQVPAGMTANEILSKLATDQIGTPRPTTEYVTCGAIEVVAPAPPQTFTLTVEATTGGWTTPNGTSTQDSGTVVELRATPEDCYRFLNWSANGTFISSENPLLVTISSDTLLTANFEYTCDKKFKFYIRASTHPLLNPRWRNYPIPIYIRAEENISGAIIEQLVIEIDRTLFNPHRVGHLTSRDNGFMIFENVPVPNLIANEEQLLFNIWGDIMLGNKDSSAILVSSAKFSDDLDVELEFIAGYLTIEICRAGGDRLLRWFDYVPAVLVKNNPVTSEILEVECRTIEIGSYSLEVIDLLGHTAIIKEWEVTPTTTDLIFNFDIPIDNFNFTSGNYLLVMHTPTSRYITKFVISQ